jgi:3-dehydroquinate synthetase
MLCAARLSETCAFAPADQHRIGALVTYLRTLLAPFTELKQVLEQLSPAEALKGFRSDKKHRKDEFALIVFDQNGFLERRFVSASGETETRITEVFDWLRKEVFT